MSNLKPNVTEITNPPRRFVSGDVDGLMSCTESLGFESSDERRVNDDDDVNCDENENDEIWRRKMMMKKAESRGNLMRSFPPPLTSLNRNGKPSFYLRPVRKDGRTGTESGAKKKMQQKGKRDRDSRGGEVI
ncbi:hypothetical protein TSUD_345500 [Trifolium subterraneum]|nr:hypothetical protein TSUD_345500 [Trifolium subterraneum]